MIYNQRLNTVIKDIFEQSPLRSCQKRKINKHIKEVFHTKMKMY